MSKQTKGDRWLFWHRADLRLTDNLGLAATAARGPVVGVFCFDPAILSRDDLAPARVAYLVGCLGALQADYRRAGGELLLVQGAPEQAIPALAEQLGVVGVGWNWDVEPYAQGRDRAVTEALQVIGRLAVGHWDSLLHAPTEILTGNGQLYTVYTPFWKNWQAKPKAAPVAAPSHFAPVSRDEIAPQGLGHQVAILAHLPTAAELGWAWDGPWVLEPGSAAAEARLAEFTGRAIEAYDEGRNFPGEPGTSQLSPALKFGVIGIRQVWQAASQAADYCRSDEARKGVETWQKELAWREFYHHALYHLPELAETEHRPVMRNFPWENNADWFAAWCAGRTGYPIVDAAMRELNETGWMHNRCRMIVASFLTKDLLIDWRWGEKYFMQRLVDGNLAANNGGWQWSASCGLDPRPLRIFNPASQAQKFDPEATYIRRWLPELASLDTESLLTGKIAPLERRSLNYPPEIVNHRDRQERFKALYQAQKEGG